MTFHEDYVGHQSWPPLVVKNNKDKIFERNGSSLIYLEHFIHSFREHLIRLCIT